MAKAWGVIGYSTTVEIRKGVWEPSIKEVPYSGDLLRNRRTYNTSNSINGMINISNSIKLIFDPTLLQNYQDFKYITLMGQKWCIDSIEIEPPHMTITLGGKYNGKN